MSVAALDVRKRFKRCLAQKHSNHSSQFCQSLGLNNAAVTVVMLKFNSFRTKGKSIFSTTTFKKMNKMQNAKDFAFCTKVYKESSGFLFSCSFRAFTIRNVHQIENVKVKMS